MAASMKIFRCQTCIYLNTSFLRHISVSNTSQSRQKSSELTAPPPDIRENDWIGPPDKVSNIRQVEFYIPKDETELERKYREQRQAILDWHHEFWSAHNKSFFKSKEEFIQQRLAEKKTSGNSDDNQSLSPEELSEFYKKFLDENYRTHIQYNKEWYKKNIMLLWPALQVSVLRLISKLKNNRKKT